MLAIVKKKPFNAFIPYTTLIGFQYLSFVSFVKMKCQIFSLALSIGFLVSIVTITSKYDESRLVDEFHDCNNKTNSKGMFNRLSQEHKSVFGWKSYASCFQMKVCMSRQVSSMDVIHRYGQNLIYGWTNPSKRMGSHISHRVFRLSKPCRFKI